MRLNSTPSAANSSWPFVGTRVEKSPRPRRWAASSSSWMRRCSDCDVTTAKVSARMKKPTRIAIASSRVRDALVARRTVGPRTPMRAWDAWKSGAGCVRASRSLPPTSTFPSRGRSAGVAAPSVDAATRPLRRTTAWAPVRRRTRAAKASAVVAPTSSRPTSRPAASSSWRVAGRIAAGSPTSLTVARSRVSRMRAAPSARRSASRRARRAARSPSRTAVATWRSCATRVATRSPWATVSCTRPAIVRCCAASCVLALPVSLVPMRAKTMKPTATIGTRTIRRKKSVSRPRKLIRRLNVALQAERTPRPGRTAGYAVRTFAGL